MAKYGLTPQGPNPKRLDVILEDMHSKMTDRLGVNTRQNPQSLLNHILTDVADEVAELWEFGVDVYHSQYTSSATGVSLDYAAQFGGSTREMAAKSYYSILCTGLDGTTIPAGTVIASDTNPATSLTATADATITRSAFNKATVILASPAATTALGVALNGNLYTITPDPKQSTSEALEALGTAITDKDFHVTVINDTIVIEAVDETSSNTLVLSENLTTASVGSIVTFETAEPGDIFIPNGVITKITKAVPGMESVVNVGSYVAGQLAESDVEFRKSYTNKIYNRSSAMLESIKSAILKNVQGVVSVAPYENCTDAYRTYLIYKIWKNTNNCTYYDIIRAFKMFWDKPLHYREDPAIPATMIFETDALTPEADVSKLLNAPFIKAAGVAILVVANTEAPEMVADVPVEGILGRGYTTTTLPEIETGEAFIDTVLPVPAAQNITQTKLPELEEDEL